jgi:hypothetical protein
MRNIQFDVAEVLEYDKTYQYIEPNDPDSNIDKLFAIKVRSCTEYFNKKPFIVKPSNINFKQIPLVGEFVLIYKTFNQVSTSDKWRESWYYITAVDIQSSVHANLLPGLSGGKTQEEIDNTKPGKTFDFRIVSPLQPYEGDMLMEGRWGNSIRFSSTVDLKGTQNHYHIDVPWKGSTKQGDPIIILSNGRKTESNKKFVVENIQTDAASLYLTSTQKLSSFQLNNIIRTSDSETSFNKSQLIGTADRITLKSKSDIIVLDSNTAVEINTPLLSIGQKPNSFKEYGLHSEQVKDLFDTIIDILNFGLIAGSTPVTINPALKSFFDSQIQLAKNKIDNELIKQDKA